MSGQKNVPQTIAVSTAFAVLTVFLGYCVRRQDFSVFIAAYGGLFVLYAWLVFIKKNLTVAALRWYTAFGIVLRILLLFNIPNLSDDFYRFLWDGRLTAAGVHPFAHPPAYFMEHVLPIKGITPELFARLNSPHYFTVYPPLCQAMFWIAAKIYPTSLGGGTLVLKVFLLLSEIGTIGLLSHWAGIFNRTDLLHNADRAAENQNIFPPYNPRLLSVLYALNPLLILEIVGNCHFEGVMIFFLMAGLRCLQRQKNGRAAIFWAFAAAVKLIPLLFLPIVWRWLGWRKGLVFNVVFGTTCLLLFLPLLDKQVLINMSTSLDLYFQLFQFNGSIFYVVWKTTFEYSGFEKSQLVGPVLGLCTVAGILLLAWKTRPFNTTKPGGFYLLEAMLFASFLHLTLSATVHPWYATLPLALGFFTRWRFAVLWSGLIALSYSHYIDEKWMENYLLIALEYAVLWMFMIVEKQKGHPKQS